MKLTIKKNNSGKRLDIFLTKTIKEYSRNQIQQLAKQGLVLVNGKTITPHYFLKTGDEVLFEKKKKINEERNINLSSNPKKNIIKKINDNLSNIKIVAKTKNYIIVNKPAGLITHGAEHIKSQTLADYFTSLYPSIKKVGDDPSRPGIVHRLDKEASGLMIVTKTQAGFDFFKNLFKKRLIEKNYTALVYGNIDINENQITFPIKRSASGFRMASLPLTKRGKKNIDGREAITEFTVIKKYINYTLLKLNIKTGRTHQIRVHLSAYGHPIVGDNLYGTKKTKEKNKKLDLKRIFLVATRLSFTDIDGQRQIYTVDLPEELQQLLKIIK